MALAFENLDESTRRLMAQEIDADLGEGRLYIAENRLSNEGKRQYPVLLREASLVLRPRDYVTKLVSGLLTCKLPLDGGPVAVHAASPGPSLLAQASDVSDSAFS